MGRHLATAERLQSNRARRGSSRMDLRGLLRSRSGHRPSDDRKLPFGTHLEVDAQLRSYPSRIEACRLRGGLAMTTASSLRNADSRAPYNLLIVGAGPAGLAAAEAAALRGARVALIERDLLGGTCL